MGDFIKDEQGIWWLINIRKFKLKTEMGLDIKRVLFAGESGVIDPMNPPVI